MQLINKVLIDDWRDVAAKAWSVRWIVLGNLLALAPMLADGLDGVISDRAMLKVVLVTNIAALIGRFLKQPGKGDA